ncbi:hypothetical protein A2W54_02175 [Candidatus Giovannonibacteria bacterium RIFCSPHIGHO2_02_43_13]|uniref:Plasmid pRiA4b Orf3-like domain-containing protein n=1 Tax=Candidatus Giovannonibacteria bacterium RIFCSPHIGHO2_02_43_13 TaxID=1798330 RepID=A0A1F5WUE6_9BACT|nr:MAG: hypothetical protein UW28_C0010G0021 [Parcubacteria group bacterium GW2011_GWA2_44_13]OGF73182.1 MAG: hypothetical protein A3E06_04380 [Candidatus Giovannonibacteria bacterium RIFCSPHIGHO2_12_FULL_44_42]OGF79266.1 MAG: hypothetical protein A2W54_02175 [Candidatus Giovannonibacteria bacterium RIFCSPHIGHO2_02_43_13]OGF88726.1 MAG: hypothetical protein A3I94_01440 [Candidatus Giovannonibacteria bacterium RIFCSPLOWO2_02_FULL_43_54]
MKKRNTSEGFGGFQFKITLNDSKPSIWRRIIVPADYTFFDLHCAIQNAMGWTDSHLHAFYIGEKRNKTMITIQIPDPEEDDSYRGKSLDERKERVADYFSTRIRQCVYCYDFGDNWDHTVLFERLLPRDQKIVYPKCVAGKNACPPEDCGSIWGYEDLKKIVQNPKHPEHGEMLEWLCIDDPSEFDPSAFNPDEVEFENPKQRLKEYERGFGGV